MDHDDPYPVRALLVFAANPALTHANTKLIEEGLKKLNFLVVTDIFMTPTAQFADIILPACTFLERSRFVAYDTHTDHGWNQPLRIGLSPRVVEPMYESKPDWRIIWEIGRKLGYADYFPWRTEEEAIDAVLALVGLNSDLLADEPNGVELPLPSILYKAVSGFFAPVIRKRLQLAQFRTYPDMYEKYEGFMEGFRTPSGKVEFYSQQLKDLGQDPLPIYHEPAESPISQPDLAKDFPLVLIAGSKLRPYTHPIMRNIPSLRKLVPETVLEINPVDAKQRGIFSGDRVEVTSPCGEIQCKVEVTTSIAAKVVHLHFGFEEGNANILIDNSAFDPITGSTGLKSSLCQVEKI